MIYTTARIPAHCCYALAMVLMRILVISHPQSLVFRIKYPEEIQEKWTSANRLSVATLVENYIVDLTNQNTSRGQYKAGGDWQINISRIILRLYRRLLTPHAYPLS